MMKNILAVMALMGAFNSLIVHATVVKVAQEQRVLYQRDDYLAKILIQALKTVQYPAEFQYIDVHPHQQRTLLMLSQGKVDIHWSMTSSAREQLAIPIRVPLFKGLIGWRVLLISEARAAQFLPINTPEQLKPLRALQGHDWPDTKILTQNGYAVMPHVNYESMFGLLVRGRGDYFPRSVIEVQSELAVRESLPLMIEPHLILKYPTAFYFFVNQDKPELALALEKGLLMMHQNGEFNRIFEQYFADFLSQLNLASRLVFELENTNLPDTTPLMRKELWFQPNEGQ
ncbi:substrate-binding periplasmic protein [Pseudoalteromonas ulvae]|uniref:Uncharacterized protein n=1 Tax=Pseudoalteromonas ulvae TaxID=107327 RepID=A0A244CNE9_PSEDV|nr:transporter substrate-binding domain-containing protein [Pseudoalteromonas ulvae]OUL57150.1 hypothetical protein B1199_13310 [Pseudoalteromonas ulvae]